jgi:Superinfection exclusion gene product 17
MTTKLKSGKATPTARHGQLKVWWIPQIPGRKFEYLIETLVEAKTVLNTLAEYDMFLLQHGHRVDYSNAGGLMVFDEDDTNDGPLGSWVDWYSEDGTEFDDIGLSELRSSDIKWEGDCRPAPRKKRF